MAIAIICPRLSCRAVLRVPDNIRGKRVRCSTCGNSFFVPATPNPVVAAPANADSSDAKDDK